MDEAIYVMVTWNKDDDRVEVDPSSVELTDAVEWVSWTAGGLPPRPNLTVRFHGFKHRGPFKEMVVYPASVGGSGNRGPGLWVKARRYSYKVVLQTPDGPKSGCGLVINRATRP